MAIAGLLDVEVNSNGDVVESDAPESSLLRTSGSADEADEDTPNHQTNVAKLKPHFTNLNARLEQANDKAEQRMKKTQARANKAMGKWSDAVKKVTKNLAPKTSEKPNTTKAAEGAED